tara:strand:- start:111 stop:1055 length:945 start_codon:yes stop_codon:yes gene_type:complete
MIKKEKKIISIIGGAGFIGKYLVNSLLLKGYYINVISRNADILKKQMTTIKLGQCRLVNCNIGNKNKLLNAIEGSNIVVNLVGLLENRKSNSFETVHVEGTKNLFDICKKLNIERIIHLSAIGVKKGSLSKYSDTKYQGEKIIKKYKKYTIIRPSIVYGAEDNFINYFAKISKISPFLPLIGNGKTKFQPIWVQDLVNIIIENINKNKSSSNIFEVGGEDIITFREIIIEILREIQIKRILINIPFYAANKLAFFTELLPKPILTRDQVEMLKEDNIVSKKLDYRKSSSYVSKPFKIMLAKQLRTFRTSGGHLS